MKKRRHYVLRKLDPRWYQYLADDVEYGIHKKQGGWDITRYTVHSDQIVAISLKNLTQVREWLHKNVPAPRK